MPKIFKSVPTVLILLLIALPLWLASEGALAAAVEMKGFYASINLPDRWSADPTQTGEEGAWFRADLEDSDGVASVSFLARRPMENMRFRRWRKNVIASFIRSYSEGEVNNVGKDDRTDKFHVTLGSGQRVKARAYHMDINGNGRNVIFVAFALYPDTKKRGPWYMLFVYNQGIEANQRDALTTILKGLKLHPPEASVGQR